MYTLSIQKSRPFASCSERRNVWGALLEGQLAFRFSIAGLGNCPVFCIRWTAGCTACHRQRKQVQIFAAPKAPWCKGSCHANSVTEGLSLRNILSYDNISTSRPKNLNLAEIMYYEGNVNKFTWWFKQGERNTSTLNINSA